MKDFQIKNSNIFPLCLWFYPCVTVVLLQQPDDVLTEAFEAPNLSVDAPPAEPVAPLRPLILLSYSKESDRLNMAESASFHLWASDLETCGLQKKS